LSSLNKKSRLIQKKELTLVLNATEGRLQFVLGRGNGTIYPEQEILVSEDWAAASQGAELLAPSLAEALNRLKLSPATIGKVAAVVGPGSFTGLRLVTVTANALVHALNAESAAIEYLPLLAAGVQTSCAAFLSQARAIWALTYARRDLVYLQGFMYNGPDQKKITPLLVLGLDESLDFLREQNAKYGGGLLFGSGLTKNLTYLSQKLDSCFLLLPAVFNHPTPDLLLKTASGLNYSTKDLTPTYLRPSDAEENLPQIAAKLGLDQNLATARLRELLDKAPA
jgi:tRNA threonylcarbamoyl adenosine modification protein YeaZ